MRPPFAPQHVFEDITDILPRKMTQAWAADLEGRRASLSAALESVPQADRACTRKALVQESGAEFIANAISQLEGCCGSTQHRCAKHNMDCQGAPDLFPGQVHIEISGTVCVGFSSMGSLWGWLDNASIPFVSWSWKMRTMRPAVIIHECVRGFDAETLSQALNAEDMLYVVETAVFDATDLGLPVRRPRRYSVCWRQDTSRSRLYSEAELAKVAFKAIQDDASVFLVATSAELEMIKAEMIEQAQLEPDYHGRPWSWRAVLPAGDHRRLRAAELGGFAETPGIGLLSLSQNPDYQGTNSMLAPALIRSSKLYRLVDKRSRSDRLIMPSEYWALQMLPVNLPTGHLARSFFNEDDLKRSGVWQSLNHARALAGNGMNVAAVGAVLLFVVSSLENVKDRELKGQGKRGREREREREREGERERERTQSCFASCRANRGSVL